MRAKHILLVMGILVAMAVLAVPVAADHQITFENTCNQDVYINLQGGPQGVCDNNKAACSGCEVCGTDTFGNSIICNTSAVTGNDTPLCCPGSNTDMPYCNTGESCIPEGCCPGVIATAGQSYNCPQGGNYAPICGNQSMTPAQIDALSGYNNASTGRHRIACNGSMIAGGGFKLDASTGIQTYNFPDGWNGGFFPRTGCTFDENGFGNCTTGNCIDGLNRGLFQCGGAGSASPAVKAEINFGNTWVDVDNYDISYVNGFNVAMVFTPTQYNATYVGNNQCTSGGCAVNLSSFSSPKVPSWDMLKYTSVSNFLGIYDTGDYFYNTHIMTGDPHTGPNAANWSIFYGYSCPISEGYVNDSSISCADVPGDKTCKTCAGQNTNLYPFNQPGALPNSANLFFDTCPNAYAYTYNDTAALMTCMGTNATTETNYKITVSCDGGTIAPTVANFTANITAGRAPLAVQFNDTSSGSPVAWNWSFGDGALSNVQNPKHVYTNAGTYTVSLKVTNDGGSNTKTRINYIAVTLPPSGNVDLGLAGNFVILTKTGITNTGTTSVTGNMGVSPIAASAITGFGLIMDPSNEFSTSSLVTGKVYAADYAVPTPNLLTTAVNNMDTAYTDAAGRVPPTATELYAGNLGGKTLTPGIYKWSSGVLIPTSTTLTLDAQGNASAVWIFQVAEDLTMESATQVILINGAKAENIYWQIGGGTGVTIEAGSHAEGNILAAKAISMKDGASLNGRALAQTAVTLIANTVTVPALVFVNGTIINQSATVFIGEQGLNVTHALNQAQGNPAIDGIPPLTRIGWWAPTADIGTNAPNKTIDLSGRYTSLIVAPSDFVGYTGTWYVLQADSQTVAGVAFIVADPSLDIRILDFTHAADVTGKSVPQNTRLGFGIDTNMYPAVDARYRSPVNPDTDGYINIRVKDASGTTLNTLYNNSASAGAIAGPHTLIRNFVNAQPWSWGSNGTWSWQTSARDNTGQYAYPPGNYTASAESTLNHMKDNYKNGSADYTGKTVSPAYALRLRVCGDFNGNDVVDIGDVARVAYMVAGLSPVDMAADFNNVGSVDIGDAAKIAYYLVGKIPQL